VWKPLPQGDHNTSVLEPGYFEAIAEFMESLTLEAEKKKKRVV